MNCSASACTFSVATKVCGFTVMVWISRMWYCSFFSCKMKQMSLWDLQCYPRATEVLLVLSNPVDDVLTENSISAIERIICLMYHKTTFISNVNDYSWKKVKLSITCPQLKMLWFNTLKGKYTRVGKIVTNMLRYSFCTISLIVVFIFQTKRQTL